MNEKDKALEIVAGCSNWSDIQHRIVPRIEAALTAARKDAREVAFRDVVLLVSTRLAELKIQTASLDGLSGAACLGRDIAIEDLLRAIEAAANTEEGGGELQRLW